MLQFQNMVFIICNKNKNKNKNLLFNHKVQTNARESDFLCDMNEVAYM